jgi:uncharacterized protein
MSIQDNKQLVERFNAHFEHSDIDGAMALLTDDCVWWVNAKPHLFPVAGDKTKTEYGDLMREIHASLEGGMRREVLGMVAEGDRVAAELRAYAVTKAGKVYDNRYHMLYTIRDGRIAAAREYTDLLAVKEVFS